FPRVGANQIAYPKWDDHQLIEKILFHSWSERKVVRERITEQQGKDCHPRGNPHGAKQGLQIHVDAKELTVVVEGPGMNDRLGRRQRPEAVTEQQSIGQQEKQCDPESWRDRDGGSISAGKHLISLFQVVGVAPADGIGRSEFQIEIAVSIVVASGSL